MTMRALLWKDARIFTDVLLAGIALLAGSYFLALLLVYADSSSGFAWSKVIAGGASLARFSSILICALLGAYAFAREGEECSGLFLASLPARKGAILLSKAIIAVALFLTVWLASLLIMALGLRAMGYGWDTLLLVLEAMLGYIASGVMAFGVAWYLSLFMGSPVGAAFAGLMTLMPVYAAQFLANDWFDIENPMFFHPVTVAAMFALGIAGVAGGCLRYSRFGGAPNSPRLNISLPWRRDSRRADVATAWSLADLGEQRTGPFRALLWKDIQLLRTSFKVAFVVLALPYLVALASHGDLGALRTASVISIALSVLIFSFWSGHIMSAETGSRTGDFLAALPATRLNVLRARLAVVLTPMLGVTALNLLVLFATNHAIPGAIRFGADLTWTAWTNAPHLVMGLGLANGAALGFAVAWFLSACYQRPAVAIVAGVMTALVGLAFWAALAMAGMVSADGLTPVPFVYLFSSGNALIAAALLAAGCAAAGRRRETSR
ncbi:MAG: hypothetical protein WC655_15155 [Candidatus Hydrogenedentales bacterium]|jgi:ABC-type transport system involved in multi-copper enzyme maturation permease subunit